MDKNAKIIIAVVVAAIVVVAVVAAALLMNKGNGNTTVQYINLAPKDMKAHLTDGDIDAYIAWEPYVSDSIVGGVGTALLWSSDLMPNHPCCVVAVSDAFLSGPNGVVLTERFLKAHLEATAWMNDALAHPSGANYTLLVEMAVKFTGRSAAVIQAAFEHLEFKTEMTEQFKDSLKTFTDMYIELNATSTAVVTGQGYSSTTDFVNKFVNGTPLDAAASIEPSSTIVNEGNPIRMGYLLGDLHQMAQVVAQNVSVGEGKSLFTKYGISVTNSTGAPYANGGAEMSLGFKTGAEDIGYLGAPPAIINHLNSGIGIKVVAQANTEGSGIVVKVGSGITSLKGLVNKTVATPGESSIQFLLLKNALEEQGLQLKIKT